MGADYFQLLLLPTRQIEPSAHAAAAAEEDQPRPLSSGGGTIPYRLWVSCCVDNDIGAQFRKSGSFASNIEDTPNAACLRHLKAFRRCGNRHCFAPRQLCELSNQLANEPAAKHDHSLAGFDIRVSHAVEGHETHVGEGCSLIGHTRR
jgi:hypothetical protein